MYVDLHCGMCESQMMMDSDDNNSGVWMLVHRFSNAHSACGFVSPPAPITENETTKTTSVSSPRRRVIKKSRMVDEDE